MLKFILLSLFSFSLQLVTAQTVNQTFINKSGTTHLLGQVTIDRFSSAPFDSWYKTNYDNRVVDSETLKGAKLPDSVTIFMGTWCGDSRKNVPAMVKILEKKNFDLLKLKIICLNTGFQNYKQAPFREEKGVGLHRVPLIIFQKSDGTEIGRIVEEPIESLEKDMAKIMKGEKYTPSYPIADDLRKLLKDNSITKMQKMESDLLKKYGSMKNSKYELNTYGYKLWSAFRLLEAEFIYDLNIKLFPKEASVYSMAASLKKKLGKFKEAKKLLTKGLALDAENEDLKRKLDDLKKLMK